jgi:hypothetical protein
LAHPSITPVCETRVQNILQAQTIDFGGKCSYIHCPGQFMEAILQFLSRAYAAHPETTSAILALPESEYSISCAPMLTCQILAATKSSIYELL